MKIYGYYLLLFFFLSRACNLTATEKFIEPEGAFALQEKSLVKAHSFMVATAHPLATKAGFAILKKGGSAVDAAVTIQMVLSVVEPQSSGIGGGGLMLVHDPKLQEPLYFNGREVAPRKILADLFLKQDKRPIPFEAAVKGGTAVGVPGVLKLLETAHQQYGKLPWSDLFEEAILIAKEGFSVTPRLHRLAIKSQDLHRINAPFLDKYGQAPAIGSHLQNKTLANTFSVLAKEGIAPFYTGSIADSIVHAVQNAKFSPGFIEKSDLGNYSLRQGKARCFPYRTYSVCSTGDTISGAITLFEILGILNHFDLKALGKKNVETYNIIQQAMAIGFADRNQFIADDRFAMVPVDGLLHQDYFKERADEIKNDPPFIIAKPGKIKISVEYQPTTEKEVPSTTHFSIIDSHGLAVSMTSSIEHYFGSGIEVEGFFLNSQMTDFSFEPSQNGRYVANRAEPFKQPRSAMTPVLVYDKHHQLKLILGSAGGPWIIPYVLQTILNVIDFDMDIQNAISDPHFANLNNGVLELEENGDLEHVGTFLQAKKMNVKFKRFDSGTHGIHLLNTRLEAGADPRREGTALGE